MLHSVSTLHLQCHLHQTLDRCNVVQYAVVRRQVRHANRQRPCHAAAVAKPFQLIHCSHRHVATARPQIRDALQERRNSRNAQRNTLVNRREVARIRPACKRQPGPYTKHLSISLCDLNIHKSVKPVKSGSTHCSRHATCRATLLAVTTPHSLSHLLLSGSMQHTHQDYHQ